MTRARNSANLASHGNLFVDIANDRTGIGSVVPAQNLHVAGTAGFHADTTFTGDLYNATWDRSDNSLKFVDNAKIKVGTDGDLEIYFNGSQSVVNGGTSNLLLLSNIVQISTPAGSKYFKGQSGVAELYHSDSSKLATTAYGTNTTGTAVNDGLVVAGVATVTTMNVTGVLTYDDVTSVDSVGIVTARAGVSITGGDLTINTASPTIHLTETNGDPDYRMFVNGGIFTIVDDTNNVDRLSITTSRITLNDTVLVNDNILYIGDKLVHWGDDNTAIRFPAADQVSIETAGAERLNVSASQFKVTVPNSAGDYVSHWNNTSLGVKFYDASGASKYLGLASEDSGTSTNHKTFQIYRQGSSVNRVNIDTSGNLNIVSGSLTLPDSIVHTGDTNTKIRFPTADTFTVETAGNERFRIHSTGLLELKVPDSVPTLRLTPSGTNAPATIDFNTPGTGSAIFKIQNSERLRINSTGNMGLGVSDPNVLNEAAKFQELTIGGKTEGAAITLKDDNGNVQGGLFTSDSTLAMIVRTITNHPMMFRTNNTERLRITSAGEIQTKARSAEVRRMILSGSPTNTAFNIEAHDGETGTSSGDVQGKLGLFYNDGSTLTNTANISFERGSGAADGAMAFVTNQTERLRITSSGNLLLGTTSDTQRLHVYNGNGAAGYKTALFNSNDTANGTRIIIANTGNTSGRGLGINVGGQTYGPGQNKASFGWYNTDNTFVTHSIMTITSAGDVGIGYNSPTVKLHVRQGASGASSYDNRYHMICENSGEAYLGFYVPDNSFAGIRFADTTGNEGYIDYYFNTDEMVYYSTAIHRWSTNGSERLRIDSSGRVGINKTPALASSKLEVGGADNYPLINVEASGATAGVGIGGGALQFFYGTSEKARITSAGYIRLGNLGYSTSKVGGQAVTAQDFDPYLKLYASTNNHWLMQLRSDTATGGNGIFLRSSNSSSNYSMFVTGYDESKPHIVARGDSRVGIATTNPRTTLHVEGSISGGTINQPFQRQFSKTHNHQRETKHYFRCVGGNQTYDIITVDLNSNFHQAVCEVLYGTRLQNISDSQTQPNKIIFGINRFLGNTPSIHKQVLYQHTNAANHADVNIVATSSSQYRVRIVMSSSCGGSSFCGGYVELIAVGSGSDGSFYSLSHSHGLLD